MTIFFQKQSCAIDLYLLKIYVKSFYIFIKGKEKFYFIKSLNVLSLIFSYYLQGFNFPISNI